MADFSKIIYTRKQANVVYRQIKLGNLAMSKAAINKMYSCADVDVMPETADGLRLDEIKYTVDAIFQNDFAWAQAALDKFAEFVA